MSFKKRFFGKWVLSGEYSVLRSGSALVYPLTHYYMDFTYKESSKNLSIKKTGTHQTGLDFSFTPVLHEAFTLINKKNEQLKGHLEIKGCIPFGSGLGASATLCAGISYLFLHKKWIKKNQLQSFATQLENFFHGTSSGMDVTVALKQKAILYQKEKVLQTLSSFKQQPLLFLSYSGGRSATSVGVTQVRKLFDKDCSVAEKIDKQMKLSVELCLQALVEIDKQKSLSLLTEAIELACSCFEKWNLISYDLKQHIQVLKKHGALATKPTGSGLGGHVISLWDKKIPTQLKKQLIPLSI